MRLELVTRGIRVGKERVWRKRQGHGIKAQSQKKFAVTTDSKHKFPVAPNLLKRKFTTGAPDQVWIGDITCIETGEG